MRRLAIGALIGVASCTATAPGGGAPPDYRYARIIPVEPALFEVEVRLRNPTRAITTERYGACVAAGHAKAGGFVWLDRLRGKRRISGADEDLVVRYAAFRFDRPEDADVISAALFLRLCELDAIPAEERDAPPDTALPALSLGGAEPPPVPRETVTDLTPPVVIPRDPADGPPTDPETGI